MDVKVGDVVHVRGEVVAIKDDLARVDFPGSACPWVANKNIVHVEPRPLAVGDKVRELATDDCIGEVRAIDGDQVWVLWHSGWRETYLAVNIARVSSTP